MRSIFDIKPKTVLVEITQPFSQDLACYNVTTLRPKWWDDFVGEKFRCHPYSDSSGWWVLSIKGLVKLSKIRKKTAYSAVIYLECGKEINK